MTNKNDKLKIRVDVRPDPDGVVPDITEILEDAEQAGWSDDPGTGVAVMLLDGNGNPAYEVLNPMPFALPIGYEPTPPIEQLIRDRVKSELSRLKDDDELDDINDAEDFDIPDELPPLETIYEVIAMDREAPALKDTGPSLEDRAKADVEYEELKERQRLLRKRHREAALKKAQEAIEIDKPE